MKTKLIALALAALFLAGCAGSGYNPGDAHPHAYDATRGGHSPGSGGFGGGDSGGEGDAE